MYPIYYKALEHAAKTVLQDKIVYGSAAPFRPLEDWQIIAKFGLDPEIEDKLLYANAANLLGME